MSADQPSLLESYRSYDQWKNEHDDLYVRLLELCRLMKWNPTNYDYSDWETHHRTVRGIFVPFMREWQVHLEKERKALYPIVEAAICGGPIGPASVLEQDGRIVGQFQEQYEKAVGEGVEPEEALRLMLQVLTVVAEHFRLEDENVVPATERFMEQIEYSGS
ncbi:hemerythrin domain-containing protein [Cohnella endophytica]|uniref:Hemerythrin domain-containing protein n=1 Tax=Cohnella endophytica TaxID=2419778 RepID=A0A494XZK5_9BACL|nr:hemerythrin domain-containing protein [Cohnella endophytica]RKP52973.1 hemerythrin domain-containing protein [Cohnella endophytica]